jgi:threonine dehydrogenase-like Zn-dependent dehydrogenase
MIEPTACCVNGVELAAVRPGETVGLVGCGYMGSIILELLALSPAARVVVFDLRPESLEYARGIAKIHDHIEVVDVKTLPKDTDAYDGVFDTTFETAATEPALRLANRSVRRGGKLMVFSWHHHDVQWDFGYWHTHGLTVINASPAASADFDSCFRRSVPLLETGRVSMDGLVTHVAKPENAQKLFEDGISKENGYIKGVIDWS